MKDRAVVRDGTLWYLEDVDGELCRMRLMPTGVPGEYSLFAIWTREDAQREGHATRILRHAIDELGDVRQVRSERVLGASRFFDYLRVEFPGVVFDVDERP